MICFKSKCSERPCTVVIDFLSFRCRIPMWMLLLLFGRAFDSAVRRHRSESVLVLCVFFLVTYICTNTNTNTLPKNRWAGASKNTYVCARVR